MKIQGRLIFGLAILLLAGCNDPKPEAKTSLPPAPVIAAATVIGVDGATIKPDHVAPAAYQPLAILYRSRDPFEDRDATIFSNNDFGLAMYRELAAGERGNIFFSPISLSTCLSMAYAGARGRTADEMAAALRLKLPPELHHLVTSWILKSPRSGERSAYTLTIADTIFKSPTFSLRPDYLSLVEKYYAAGATDLDFSNPGHAAEVMNQWIDQNTHHMIRNMISPDDLDPSTPMVLVNAVYFKGTWECTFPKDETKPMPFFLADGKEIKTQMMHRPGEDLRGGQGKGFKLLKMKYLGGASMVVLLPDQPRDIHKFDTIDYRWLHDQRYIYGDVTEVWLPKFTLEYGAIVLNEQLKKLGMVAAFSGGADFSGMTPGGGIWIDKVVHKAKVEVSEEGTRAAAATAISDAKGINDHPTPIVFKADHPFLFFIFGLDNEILFAGRVMDPR